MEEKPERVLLVGVYCHRHGWLWVIGQCVTGNELLVFSKVKVSVSRSMLRKGVSPSRRLEIFRSIEVQRNSIVFRIDPIGKLVSRLFCLLGFLAVCFGIKQCDTVYGC